MIKLKSLSAHDGDCFFINYGNGHNPLTNILIDGGRGRLVVQQLKSEIESIIEKGENIDLLVLSHIDEDHVKGLLDLFSLREFDKSCIKRVFFNSRELLSNKFGNGDLEEKQLEINKDNEEISFKQGESVGAFFQSADLIEEMVIVDSSSKPVNINKAVITILTPDEKSLKKLHTNWNKEFQKRETDKEIVAKSPDYGIEVEEIIKNQFKEDQAIVNGSSISFILEYEGKKILMLGDAHPSSVQKKLEELYGDEVIHFDLVKVSHHGSKANTSASLLAHIDCTNFLISCVKGNIHNFPHKEALSRIISSNHSKKQRTVFYFNYQGVGNDIFTREELIKYNVEIIENNRNGKVLTICL